MHSLSKKHLSQYNAQEEWYFTQMDKNHLENLTFT